MLDVSESGNQDPGEPDDGAAGKTEDGTMMKFLRKLFTRRPLGYAQQGQDGKGPNGGKGGSAVAYGHGSVAIGGAGGDGCAGGRGGRGGDAIVHGRKQ